MNIFQIRSKPHGIERLDVFIEENMVTIGWPGIGDLTGATKDEIRERLAKVYGYEDQSLATNLGSVNAFVNTMQAGDIVLMAEGDYVHIGIVGDYEYDESLENEGMCHKRSTVWKSTVRKSDLNEQIQSLLRNRTSITKFPHPFSIAGIDRYLGDNQLLFRVGSNEYSHQETTDLANKALVVLQSYLDDEEHKLTAAIEILRYLKE
jgi:predicted Mrr-cat superfamily restriction endonuclease